MMSSRFEKEVDMDRDLLTKHGCGSVPISSSSRPEKIVGILTTLDSIHEELMKEGRCSCEKNGSGLPCYGDCVAALGERFKNEEFAMKFANIAEDVEPREETSQQEGNTPLPHPQPQQPRPSCLSFADSIFGQVKFLEDRVRTLEKELKENRMDMEAQVEERKMEICSLKEELEKERMMREMMINEKQKEIDSLNEKLKEEQRARARMMITEERKKEMDELNEELEEEKKAKMILEMRWKRMVKNIINLHACIGRLIELDPLDDKIFRPSPDKKDRQEGVMNLISRLLKTLTGTICESEKRIERNRQEEQLQQQLRIQQEAERERELAIQRKLERKMKRMVKFNSSPPVSTRSRGLLQENGVDFEPSQSSSSKDDDDGDVTMSPSKKKVRKLEDSEKAPVPNTQNDNHNLNSVTVTDEHAGPSPRPAQATVIEKKKDEDEDGLGNGDVLKDNAQNQNPDNFQSDEEEDDDDEVQLIEVISHKTLRIELIRLEDERNIKIEPIDTATLTPAHSDSGFDEDQIDIELKITRASEDSHQNHNPNHSSLDSLKSPLSEIQLTKEGPNDSGEITPSTSPQREARKHTGPKPRPRTKHGVVARHLRDGFHCLCGQSFDNIVCLRAHVRYFTYTLQRNIPCNICRKSFTNLPHLKRHLKNVHDEELPDASSACRECGIIFSTKWEQRVHMNKVHYKQNPKGGRQVTKIPRGYARARSSKPVRFSGAVDSKKVEHRRDTSRVYPKDVPKRHPCVCGMDFKLTTGLSTHLKYYSKEWQHVCDLCGAKFAFLSFLRRHMETRHRVFGPREAPAKSTSPKARAMVRTRRSNSSVSSVSKSPQVKHSLRSKRLRKVKVNKDSVDEAVVDWIIDNELQ